MQTTEQPRQRYALTSSRADAVAPYLPANYSARSLTERDRVGDSRMLTLISGVDRAGWTLDGYVIPRLASGLHFAREISR